MTEATGETDENGEFRIGNLSAGRYAVNTERRTRNMDYMSGLTVIPREVALEQGQALRAALSSPPLSEPVTVEVRAGESAFVPVLHRERAVTPPDAPIGGAVSGTVVDEFGEPVDNLTVRLWRLRYEGGRQVAEPTPLARRVSDLGQFRLFHVPPARYLLVATSDDAQHAAVYYPGVTAIGSASSIVVARRQELPGAHMVFTRTRLARLSGTARSAAGERFDITVTLISTGAITLPPVRITAGPNGLIDFPNVVPGEYVVQAFRTRSEEFGMRRVVVADGDNQPVSVVMVPTARISGRIVMDDNRALPSGLQLRAMLEPEYTLPNPVSASIGAAGQFEMRGLIGPVRLTLSAGVRGYRFKSAEIGAVNAVEDPVLFESVKDSRDDVIVTLSSDVATISGRVTDDGRELDDYRVIVFPVNRTRWFNGSPYIQIAAGPNVDGRYVLMDVPPGDYWLAAVSLVEGDARSGEWQSPDYLGDLSLQAQRVSVGERQEVVMDLRLLRRTR